MSVKTPAYRELLYLVNKLYAEGVVTKRHWSALSELLQALVDEKSTAKTITAAEAEQQMLEGLNPALTWQGDDPLRRALITELSPVVAEMVNRAARGES